jgi:amidophosphoribosyltransferase
MCAIAGIVSNSPVNQELYDALTIMQHRGQDAAGIMTSDDDSTLHLRKQNGMVRDVFRRSDMLSLTGNLGIAHCRYPTAGCDSSEEAQPMFVNSPYGISIAHNGNIINADELRKELFENDHRHINTSSDSEILLNVLAHGLQINDKVKISPDDVFEAVNMLHKRAKGGYAVVSMIAGFGVLAFRDPFGIRPLIFGSRLSDDGKKEYMIASESVALESLGFDVERDIEPGEAIFIDKQGEFYSKQCAENPVLSPCAFEFVYLARPDSVIDGVSVYEARLKMGEKLGQKIIKLWPEHDIDVVIPIPDSGRTSALQLASELEIEYQEGFVKNRYVGRTFIMPNQAERKSSVRKKLNAMASEFKGKNVLLVDDSIVRGNTSRRIVEMARAAGAKKVYFASAAPPIRYPNVYGIDLPAMDELIAHDRNESQIADIIGADKVFYQDIDDLKNSITELNPTIQRVDASCFDGDYVTGGVDQAYFEKIKSQRDTA